MDSHTEILVPSSICEYNTHHTYVLILLLHQGKSSKWQKIKIIQVYTDGSRNEETKVYGVRFTDLYIEGRTKEWMDINMPSWSKSNQNSSNDVTKHEYHEWENTHVFRPPSSLQSIKKVKHKK